MMQHERRQSARIETHMDTTIKVGEIPHGLILVDVSYSGAGCIIDKDIIIPLHRDLEIKLEHKGEHLILPAVALHSFSYSETHNKLGLKFNQLSQQQKDFIQDFVYDLLSKKNDPKRLGPRIKTKISIHTLTKDKALAVLENISLGGLSIRCPKKIDVHDFIDIELPLKQSRDHLICSGKVVHVKELIANKSYKVGIQFIELPQQIKQQLHFWMLEILQNPIEESSQ